MSASQFAKVIAESTSTNSEWSLVDGSNVVAHAIISGINPYFQTRREISHIIRLELASRLFQASLGQSAIFMAQDAPTPSATRLLNFASGTV